MLMQHRGDIAAWLRLQLTPGVGAVSTRRLLAAFSLPDQIFRQSQSALEAVVSEKQAKALLREPVGFSVALQNDKKRPTGQRPIGRTGMQNRRILHRILHTQNRTSPQGELRFF